MLIRGVCVAALAFPLPALACLDAIAASYHIDSKLLCVIVKHESRLNPLSIVHNKNGSYDIGYAGINSWWIPRLQRYGISETDLFDKCINLNVGAWILASNIKQYGNGWRAVGAYAAGCKGLSPAECESRRAAYAQIIKTKYEKGNITCG